MILPSPVRCAATTAHGVRNRITDAQRRAFGIARHAHRARHALDDLIVSRSMGQRTVIAESGNGAVDEARIDFEQRLRAQAQAIHDARAEVFDQHVRVGRELAQDLLAGLMLEVERQRLFARVHGHERRTHIARRGLRVGAETPGEIAAGGILDLEDIGAEQRKLIGAERSGQDV